MQAFHSLVSRAGGFPALWTQFIFLATGVFTTLGNQTMYYQGAAEKSTLLPVICNFVGMALGALMPTEANSAQRATSLDSAKATPLPHAKIFFMSMLDLGGNILGLFGLALAGSGTYQVIYSSIILFNALFSRMLLGKVLSQSKLVALVIIFFGLSMSAFGSSQGSALSTADSENTSRKLLGIGFTLLCTSMYGLHYAVSESIVGQPNPPPTTSIQAFSGLYTLVALGAYTLWHTIPNFDLLFLQNIRAADGDVWLISIIYPLLVLSAFLHSITYFRLLSTLGSVSTGVLQSLRAVSVFALSSLLFCDAKHQENCFNMMKLASTAVVVSGILIYTSVSSSTGAKKEPEAEKITSL